MRRNLHKQILEIINLDINLDVILFLVKYSLNFVNISMKFYCCVRSFAPTLVAKSVFSKLTITISCIAVSCNFSKVRYITHTVRVMSLQLMSNKRSDLRISHVFQIEFRSKCKIYQPLFCDLLKSVILFGMCLSIPILHVDSLLFTSLEVLKYL